MDINDLINFLRKKGFRDTFRVLMQFKDYKADKHSFYNELNKFSYYNSFFRVKDDLLKNGLISIEQNGKRKYIKLTEKGLLVYKKLLEINKIIKNN